jgi:hypothetical protein
MPDRPGRRRHERGRSVARRPNYGGEKRQKELQRQKKREAKEEKKRLRREAAIPDETGGEPEGPDGEVDSAGDDIDPTPTAAG